MPMGYELYITRAEHWWEGAETPIPEDEWQRFAATNPALLPTSSGLHLWQSEEGPSLWWSGGIVHVKGVADEEQARAIARLANQMHAVLIGDDDERYEPR